MVFKAEFRADWVGAMSVPNLALKSNRPSLALSGEKSSSSLIFRKIKISLRGVIFLGGGGSAPT